MHLEILRTNFKDMNKQLVVRIDTVAFAGVRNHAC